MAISVFLQDQSNFELEDIGQFRQLVLDALEALGVVGEAECYVSFIDSEAIAQLNLEYLGKSGPTDVLSFAVSFQPEFDLVVPRILGEILLCLEVAAKNAAEHRDELHDGSLRDEVALLLVHGVLHLSGMDHEVEDEALEMESRERNLLLKYYYGVDQ